MTTIYFLLWILTMLVQAGDLKIQIGDLKLEKLKINPSKWNMLYMYMSPNHRKVCMKAN